MEEGEARKLLALEHKRKLQEEANNKVKIAAEMAALVQMNDLALKMAEEKKVGMCNQGSDWSKRDNHHTLVYQYRLCYATPLYCTGAL